MKLNEQYSIVNKFYNSIIEVKFSGLFERKDRMSNFPIGCCDDACDLFWYYLKKNYDFRVERYNGFLMMAFQKTNLIMNGSLLMDS